MVNINFFLFIKVLCPNLYLVYLWRCRDHCASRGDVYYALQYADWCRCSGNAPHRSNDKICESECSDRCPGDSGLFCGAFWKMMVYQIDGANTDLPANGESKLCSWIRGHIRVSHQNNLNTLKGLYHGCYSYGSWNNYLDYEVKTTLTQNSPIK